MQFRLFPFRHPRFPPFPAIRGPKEEGQKLCAGDTAEALCLNSGLAVQGEATRYVAHRILFSRTKENFPKQHFSFILSPLPQSPFAREIWERRGGKKRRTKDAPRPSILCLETAVAHGSRPRSIFQRRRKKKGPPCNNAFSSSAGGMAGVAFDALLHTAL